MSKMLHLFHMNSVLPLKKTSATEAEHGMLDHSIHWKVIKCTQVHKIRMADNYRTPLGISFARMEH
jgi:hypothetical protein